MAAARILILGCGLTGKRVASCLLKEGHQVIGTAREASSIQPHCSVALSVDITRPETLNPLSGWVTSETRVLYSLPSIGATDLTPTIMKFLSRAAHVVYLSTTGVYGQQRDVNSNTRPAPRTPRESLRVQAEYAIAGNVASSLILRPAAIYGPHRGIHSAMRAGSYRLSSTGANYVSRIHVDDLASHCIAALFSGLTGAYPVADEYPCQSGEIAAYCANLLGIPLPPAVDTDQLSETRQADRRVDGSAIRNALGIKLAYPDYRVGIPACIAAEDSEAAEDNDRAF